MVPVESSFLYELFTKEEGAVAEENRTLNPRLLAEDGVESSFVFLKDVITGDRKHHFFEVPQFGSVLAFRLSVPTYTNSESFVDQLAKTERYMADCKELEELKERDEREFAQKLEEMAKANEDTTELEESFREKVYQAVERVPPFTETKHYLLVFDNIGCEDPLSETTLRTLLSHCALIRRLWVSQNLQKLDRDIESYMAMMANSDSNRLEDFKKELQGFESSIKKTLDAQLKEEISASDSGNAEGRTAVMNYLVDFHHFWSQKLIEVLDELRLLRDFTYVRFAEVFQLFFFHLGMTKEQLNVEGTNVIDWGKCASAFEWLEESKFSEYVFDEAKQGLFKPYQLCNVIHAKLSSVNWEEVAGFSFPLFVLGQYLLNLMKLRLENIRVRRERFQNKVDFRQKRIEMVKDRLTRQKEELEADKLKFYNAESEHEDQLDGGEEENRKVKNEFMEDQWLVEWKLRNPEIEIPEEPVADVDDDLAADYVFEQS